MSALLGIDYGGTRTKLLLCAANGNVLARDEVPTGSLTALAASVHTFVAGREVTRFGLAVTGTFDSATGVVGRSTNMPWLDGTAPAGALTELVGVPGVAVQDGAATATAEARLGAGRGAEDVFVVALGTGIAGAHVVGGQVRAGAHGAAGEIGHLVVGGTHTCSCGQTGCLETLIGGAQLGRRWAEERGVEQDPGCAARDVVAAAEAGDAAAVAVLERAARGLARAILSLSALLDPGVLIVGGGVARSPEWTVWPAVERARDQATFHHLPETRLAELGVWAGAHGAVLAAAAPVPLMPGAEPGTGSGG
ncbi:ROK family protein [Ruania albidiflava]|uniref:ROK family protein n=1 Tax=Ruania albidiflava TaxID=366586 RepID=UPI0023F166E5|nr:ROK family protein [Ruania albidiflava]